jgi:hypothetical protein
VPDELDNARTPEYARLVSNQRPAAYKNVNVVSPLPLVAVAADDGLLVDVCVRSASAAVAVTVAVMTGVHGGRPPAAIS